MLGALLGILGAATPLDLSDIYAQEPASNDSEWADDKNRFEDWLLRVEEGQELGPDVFY